MAVDSSTDSSRKPAQGLILTVWQCLRPPFIICFYCELPHSQSLCENLTITWLSEEENSWQLAAQKLFFF